ncbi:MAG: LamG domain-containing protein [Planctomycetes bacterium]|nr:LamG domain-containing protein [Planctomycetota bacterium]
MHIPVKLLASLLLAAAAPVAAQQDVLYYKFDETGGKKVVNYASGSGLAPAEGSLVGNNTPQFQAGRFGPGCLSGGTATTAAGSTYVATGYQNSMTGSSFTVAWYMKQRTAPPSTSYFFYSNAGFRSFTGGVAGRGLYTRSWNTAGGTPSDLILTTDVQTLAAANWVHIALVVDATALTATYYIDGVAQTPITISAGATNTTAGLFTAAGFSTTNGGLYDIDEFRFSKRAASAAEILAWKTQTSPADGPYGKACNGGTLASSGGAPKLGNMAYTLNLGGGNGAYALGVGINRLSLGGVPLPFDLGAVFPGLAGCLWECSGDLFVNGVVVGGAVTIPVPIPASPSLDGVPLWCQAIIVGTGTQQTTNGLAIGIGL